MLFVLALNVSSKPDFITYYSCQNSVNRLSGFFWRNKEKSLKPNLDKINSGLPAAEFLNLVPRISVHFRKTLNKDFSNGRLRYGREM